MNIAALMRSRLSPDPSLAPGLPIVGVLPQMVLDAPGVLTKVAHQNHGKVVELPVGPISVHLVSHPDHVRHALADNAQNFVKGGELFKPLRRLFGGGLATAEGEEWVQSRRRVQPIFTAKHVASMVDLMVAGVADGVGRLARAAGAGAPVDLASEMTCLSQKLILKLAFGASVDPDELDALGEAVFTAFQQIHRRLFLSFLPPWVPAPGERALREAIGTIDGTMHRLIRERRRKGAGPADLLSLLLDARDPETGEALGDVQIRDELVTLFITGSETVAAAVTWASYLLERHPEIQRRLRAEIAEVLGGRPPAAADLVNLPYGKMVLQEALRLYPPAWFIPRITREADVIGGHPIPARSVILLSPYVTQRDPSLWDRAESFEPDRFLPERSAGRHPYAYFPFGAGPRRCVGQHFALVEAQIVLVAFLQRWRFELVPGQSVSPRATPSLWPHRGLRVYLSAAGGG